MKLRWEAGKIRKSILEDLREFYREKGHGPGEAMPKEELRCAAASAPVKEQTHGERMGRVRHLALIDDVLDQLSREHLLRWRGPPLDELYVNPENWPGIEEDLRPYWGRPWVTGWLPVFLAAVAVFTGIVTLLVAILRRL